MCTHKVPCAGKNGQVVYRNCGKCLDCLKEYQQNWVVRLSEEFKAWDARSVIFFTLTYADTNLPVKVNFVHPFTHSSYSISTRLHSCSKFISHTERLGLKPFFYTRDSKHTTKEFLNERKALQDSYLDMDDSEKPVIIAPSVEYDDVNKWIRYCRKYFDRNVFTKPFRDKRVNPYLIDLEFENIHGVNSCYPDSAYTPSFKYWITSEYGPTTLRPHYHGVLMGVSEDMFRDVFAPWWREHFGDNSLYSVEYSVYDPNKGGALYISKYCSKGSFEHPLVTKAIHYPSGKEYISSSYINCVNWFGEDRPFVTPTFHLVSKGIGIRACLTKGKQRYWNCQCDEFTGFVCKDIDRHVVPASYETGYERPYSLVFSELEHCRDMVTYVPMSLTRYQDRHSSKVVGQSDFVVSPNLHEDDFVEFQNKLLNKKFIRAYVYKGQNKVFASLLPRYYRRYLLSPLSQVALQTALRDKSNSVFNGERRLARQSRQTNSFDAFLEQKLYCESVSKTLHEKEISCQFNRFYTRPFKGDLVHEAYLQND